MLEIGTTVIGVQDHPRLHLDLHTDDKGNRFCVAGTHHG